MLLQSKLSHAGSSLTVYVPGVLSWKTSCPDTNALWESRSLVYTPIRAPDPLPVEFKRVTHMPILPSNRVLAEERNPEPLAVTTSVPPWLVKGFDTCGSGPPLNITSSDSN